MIILYSFAEATVRKVPSEYESVQLAIYAAAEGDTVLISEGTYVENLRIFKKIVVGSQFMIDGDTSHISKTIIDGGSQTIADSGSAIYIGVPSDTTTVIIGLTIMKGKGTLVPESATVHWYFGGGICIQSKGAKIIHNRIIQNSFNYLSANKYTLGGGIGTWFSIASDNWYIIEDNLIADNYISGVQAEAAGISVVGNARILRNIIRNNTAVAPIANFAAGGIAITGHPANVIHCSNNIIKMNSSSRHGGGIFIYRPTTAGGPTVHFTNNLIVQNTAARAGAAIFLERGCFISLVNNTIADNTGLGYGNGLYLYGPTSAHSKVIGMNNIFWNKGTNGFDIFGADFESLHNNLFSVEHSFGENNFTADPKFINDGTYKLSDDSPCIGGGALSLMISGKTWQSPAFDYYGTVRATPGGSAPDIGAVESMQGTTTAPRPHRSEIVKFLHQSIQRYSIVFRPKGREQELNRGVLITLHGYDGNADEMMQYTQMHAAGDSLGFFTVYPEANERRWNSGIGENPSWPSPANDDVAYISALIDTLHARYRIDTNRVYVAGYSNGGFMGMKLASQLSKRLRGVAAVNSVITAGTAVAITLHRDIPVLLMNGTADLTVPYNGGLTGWLSTPSTLDFWRNNLKATHSADTTYYPDLQASDLSTVERYRYYNSSGKRMVWFYKVVGGSHAWPGAVSYPGSVANHDISAVWEIYSFINDPVTSVAVQQESMPETFFLSQNYPNPFNPTTTIRYAIPSSATVKLTIHDMLGREVATLVNEEQSVGWKEVKWNPSTSSGQVLSNGIYFYKIQAENFIEIRKMVFLK